MRVTLGVLIPTFGHFHTLLPHSLLESCFLSSHLLEYYSITEGHLHYFSCSFCIRNSLINHHCLSPCHVKVNIIPVIAKADTISKSELHKFKIKIMSELVSNGVQIYQFPIDDETVSKINTTMNVSVFKIFLIVPFLGTQNNVRLV